MLFVAEHNQEKRLQAGLLAAEHDCKRKSMLQVEVLLLIEHSHSRRLQVELWDVYDRENLT